MSLHLISILGTGLYEPVYYKGKSGELDEQEYVQIALMNEFKEELKKDGRITVLLTKNAINRNWKDRKLGENDISSASRWQSDKKDDIKVGNEKQGLESQLKDKYPEYYKLIDNTINSKSGIEKGIEISDTKTDEEIWELFETMLNCIEEGDEIVFDITHSFRSIPMLAIAVINYAKVLKNCKLKGIYYGAYEASEEIDGKKVAPILDLSLYNDIIDWTSAAETFIKYGNAQHISEVYKEKIAKIPDEEKKAWSGVRTQIKLMTDLSNAIVTCRGTDMLEMNKKANTKKSIKNAYIKFKESDTEESNNKIKEIKPLYNLMEKAKKEYEIFDKKENYEVGCEVVRWSIKNNMIQQGYTALEETIKTFLCYYYGFNSTTEKTRDDIVGKIITGMNNLLKNKDNERKEMLNYLLNEDPVCSKNLAMIDTDEEKEKVNDLVLTIPKEILQISAAVKELRNDINHFGFRLDPSASDKLQTSLKDNFDKFEKCMKKMLESDN